MVALSFHCIEVRCRNNVVSKHFEIGFHKVSGIVLRVREEVAFEQRETNLRFGASNVFETQCS